ncbi:hypothetical protein CLV51_1011659 [Chitinophaga niastensis]|uniref:Uncharacterized protein n=1 Tax=Chitinophaga niastensis TaxID=536980 RepID=A0A2P8HVV8_CHINA|nr:hypothetical protein CLV51_1011659 [Chitinophaga niastensis]
MFRLIIVPDRNEYYMLGSQTGDHMSFLSTKLFKDTPFYIFSGVDADVLLIKRLYFPYRSVRIDNGNATDGKVFFTD